MGSTGWSVRGRWVAPLCAVLAVAGLVWAGAGTSSGVETVGTDTGGLCAGVTADANGVVHNRSGSVVAVEYSVITGYRSLDPFAAQVIGSAAGPRHSSSHDLYENPATNQRIVGRLVVAPHSSEPFGVYAPQLFPRGVRPALHTEQMTTRFLDPRMTSCISLATAAKETFDADTSGLEAACDGADVVTVSAESGQLSIGGPLSTPVMNGAVDACADLSARSFRLEDWTGPGRSGSKIVAWSLGSFPQRWRAADRFEPGTGTAGCTRIGASAVGGGTLVTYVPNGRLPPHTPNPSDAGRFGTFHLRSEYSGFIASARMRWKTSARATTPWIELEPVVSGSEGWDVFVPYEFFPDFRRLAQRPARYTRLSGVEVQLSDCRPIDFDSFSIDGLSPSDVEAFVEDVESARRSAPNGVPREEPPGRVWSQARESGWYYRPSWSSIGSPGEADRGSAYVSVTLADGTRCLALVSGSRPAVQPVTLGYVGQSLSCLGEAHTDVSIRFERRSVLAWELLDQLVNP